MKHTKKNKSSLLTMDYLKYATNHKEFPTWIDIILEEISKRLKVHWTIAAFLVGGVVYITGLGIAGLFNFSQVYIRSLPVYLGVLGIAWVFGSLHYASISIHNAYNMLRPCLLISDKEFKEYMSSWFNRLRNIRANVMASVIVLLSGWLVVYLIYFQENVLLNLHLYLKPRVFPPEWFFPPNLGAKAFIIDFYVVCIAFPLGTTARMLTLNLFFIIGFTKFPVIPIPSIVRIRLRGVISLYNFVAFTWLVGVGLFGILLFDVINAFTLAFLIILSSIGLFTFFVPQFVYNKMLLRSHETSTQWFLAAFYKKANVLLHEKPTLKLIPDHVGQTIASLDNLAEYINGIDSSPIWVYNLSDLLWLIVGQAFSLGSVYLENLVKSLF